MRASRAFHRPWATAPTDDEAFEAYLVDSRRHDFEAMLRRVHAERDGGLLAVTLMSSDMGKLYVALSQAIPR